MTYRLPQRTLVRSVLVLFGFAPLLGSSCGDITSPSSTQNCTTTKDTNFPISGSFTTNMATPCPFNLIGTRNIAYAATGSVPQGSVTAYAYQLSITDRLGGVWGAAVSAPWAASGGNWIISVSGTYTAASGGFDLNNNGYDIANNQRLVNLLRWFRFNALHGG